MVLFRSPTVSRTVCPSPLSASPLTVDVVTLPQTSDPPVSGFVVKAPAPPLARALSLGVHLGSSLSRSSCVYWVGPRTVYGGRPRLLMQRARGEAHSPGCPYPCSWIRASGHPRCSRAHTRSLQYHTAPFSIVSALPSDSAWAVSSRTMAPSPSGIWLSHQKTSNAPAICCC